MAPQRYRQLEGDMQKYQLVRDDVINGRWWTESMLSRVLNTRLWAGGVTFLPRQLETNRLDESPEGTHSTQQLPLQNFSIWTRRRGHPGFKWLERTVRTKCVHPSQLTLLALTTWDHRESQFLVIYIIVLFLTILRVFILLILFISATSLCINYDPSVSVYKKWLK